MFSISIGVSVMIILEWVGSLLLLCGGYFIARKKRFGFYIAAVANSIFILFGLLTAQYGIATLSVGFLIISIVGIRTWKQEDKDMKEDNEELTWLIKDEKDLSIFLDDLRSLEGVYIDVDDEEDKDDD